MSAQSQIESEENGFLNDRQQRILRFAVTHGEVTRRDLEQLLRGVPGQVLQEELRAMAEMGVLEGLGASKSRCYVPAGDTAKKVRAEIQYRRPTAAEEAERRRELRELDRLLDDLEGLNLVDARMMPADLRQRLESKGVEYEPGMSFGQTIEAVFGVQERFMARVVDEELEAER